MLRKFNRRKTIRKNFHSDIIYQGILLNQASFQEKAVFTSNKVARKFFDDDLFCNMMIQKDKFLQNKFTGYQSKRLFPFYPSYIPLVDAKTILSMDEYYWTANTIEYPCLRCNETTISFLGDFKLKNVLCGKCIEDHYINKKGIFDKRLHEHEYSKFHQDFYKINKEHQQMVFSKLIKREKSLYSTDTSIRRGLKKSYTAKLQHIEKVFKSLTN
tara:strand:- start:11535 stop:12176 length:642 start_codon:yes stop_codon:yes gene_type:complete